MAFCCACANGYDGSYSQASEGGTVRVLLADHAWYVPGSLMTGVIAMDYFQNQFHTGTTGAEVSLSFSLYTM